MLFKSSEDAIATLVDKPVSELSGKVINCGVKDGVLTLRWKDDPDVWVKVFPNRDNGCVVKANFGYGTVRSDEDVRLEKLGENFVMAAGYDGVPWNRVEE